MCDFDIDMNALRYRVFTCCVVVASASCAPAGPPAPSPVPVIAPPLAPAPLPPTNAKLPPVPEVRGPLQITVTYPKPDQLLAVRDSNFIFGNVGTGDAALHINGVSVPVWPNGAFMGWLPVPPDSAPRYELLASLVELEAAGHVDRVGTHRPHADHRGHGSNNQSSIWRSLQRLEGGQRALPKHNFQPYESSEPHYAGTRPEIKNHIVRVRFAGLLGGIRFHVPQPVAARNIELVSWSVIMQEIVRTHAKEQVILDHPD